MHNETYLKDVLLHIAQGHSTLCPCGWIGPVDELLRRYDEAGMQLVCPVCGGGEIIHGVEDVAAYALEKIRGEAQP